jgi:hypothetical protein
MKCPQCHQENDPGAGACEHCHTKLGPSLRIPSSKSAKTYKIKILKMLSESLKVFKPEYNEHFLCPTCLDVIPLNKKDEITEAHIIPRVVKGKIKTYLCDKCNHSFGTKQDKWFGELLKTVNTGIPRYIPTDIKEGAFRIDDIKVNGAWQEDKDGVLAFYIRTDRNSPAINKAIAEKFKTRPPSLKVSVPIPILKNKRMIEIGFLTAGYLMWFGALGYSWVLQDHLNPIREQIRNPDKEILKSQFIVYCDGIRWPEPWIGLITIDDEIFLTMGLENSLVLFPPADRPNIYEKINLNRPNQIGTDIRRIQFSPKPFYGPSVYVMFENRFLVFPNAMHSTRSSTAILFMRGSIQGRICHSISEEEADELRKKDNVVNFKSEFSPIIANWKLSERKEKLRK